MSTLSRLSFHGIATLGPEGVAVGLLPLLTCWGAPEHAVCLAATFGGGAPATSQLTGAFAGALHGERWLPARWLDGLENGHGGRDEAAALADALAALRCDDAPGDELPDFVVKEAERLAASTAS
eukprot:366481-Chlamydomonas_euryale.AAC.3